MNRSILNTLNCAAVVMTLCTAAIALQALAQNPEPRNRQDSADQLLYLRAFEVALWAVPAADSFAAREAVKRDLHGKPNDVAINTKPLNSDADLIALQTQTPYLQGALDLRDGPIVVEIPAATSESHLYGTICDAWTFLRHGRCMTLTCQLSQRFRPWGPIRMVAECGDGSTSRPCTCCKRSAYE
jgi:hypothetical protein